MDRQALDRSTPAELTDAIAQIASAEAVLRRALLELIAAFDRSDAWRVDGATSMEAWLRAQIGSGRRTAADLVAAANALETLPEIAATFGDGLLHWDQVRAVVGFATPETDGRLAAEARSRSPEQLARMARRHRPLGRATAEEIHRTRRVRLWWEQDRAELRFSGALPADQGAIFEQRLRQLANEMPDGPSGLPDPWERRAADALVDLMRDPEAQRSTSSPATVVVHVDAAILEGADGRAELEGGLPIGVATARRLACDARWQLVVERSGLPVGIGRLSRQVPAWLARSVRDRDGGCRFPGCGRRRWTHLHHLVHWADGGPTDLDNLIELCSYHHRFLHEHGWSVRGDPGGTLDWRRPDGRHFEYGPQPLRPGVRERIVEPIVGHTGHRSRAMA